MPTVETPSAAGDRPASDRRSASSGSGAPIPNPQSCQKRPRRVLSRLLGRLNELLNLSDFSRGDVFRD